VLMSFPLRVAPGVNRLSVRLAISTVRPRREPEEMHHG
jgi:hypothetical protein